MSRKAARARAVELLSQVGLPDPVGALARYPHEFSGGMRQRVMIAIALALEPKLLIADEPTTALDVTIQAQVLDLMRRLTRETGTSLILITHDLGVVAGIADRVAVMYAGFIVEEGSASELFARPRHPYTVGLLRSLPRPDARLEQLTPIEGSPPDQRRAPHGCPFAPRCGWRLDICWSEMPRLVRGTASSIRKGPRSRIMPWHATTRCRAQEILERPASAARVRSGAATPGADRCPSAGRSDGEMSRHAGGAGRTEANG